RQRAIQALDMPVEAGAPAKLVLDAGIDDLGSEAFPRRGAGGRAAALYPTNDEGFWLEIPGKNDPPLRLGQCTVLPGGRSPLMQRESQRLSSRRPQRHGRSLGRDLLHVLA